MRPTTYDRCVTECRRVVDHLASPAVREELLRLAAMPTAGPDGYPRSSLPESDISHHGQGDPTGEASARVVDVEEHPSAQRSADYRGSDDAQVAASDDDEPSGRPFDADLVGRQVEGVLAGLSRARAILVGSERGARAIARRGDRRTGRALTGGDCLVCERVVTGAVGDRLRAGLCEADSRAWYRYRHEAGERGAFADPVAFRTVRRQALADRGLGVVATMRDPSE